MRQVALVGVLFAGLLVGAPGTLRAKEKSEYAADVAFAVAEIEKQCARLIKSKKLDWKKIARRFKKEARSVKTHEEHLVLFVRLVAQLRDGHAGVHSTDATKDVRYPGRDEERVGPGMFWCRIGKRIVVKTSWSGAEDVGVEPGMEVVKVDDQPVLKWLDARIAHLREDHMFSTDHQAFFYACHWGLKGPKGTRLKLDLKEIKGKARRRTVVYDRAGYVPGGPAFPPTDLKGTRDVRYGRTAGGYGYIHFRRCPKSTPYRAEDAIKALGRVPGMILDFRGCSGGSFHHEGLMGRFIPEGHEISFSGGKRYESDGAVQYGGPVVVIVDATVRSAGETASGIFKEDGRGYLIGESPTAGMSSGKTTIALPSGLFSLYVSTHSNMGRSNGDRGIEGIGTIPHELVSFDRKDLAAGVDTLIRRAEELLAKFPKGKVPYDPKRFGWTPKAPR